MWGTRCPSSRPGSPARPGGVRREGSRRHRGPCSLCGSSSRSCWRTSELPAQRPASCHHRGPRKPRETEVALVHARPARPRLALACMTRPPGYREEPGLSPLAQDSSFAGQGHSPDTGSWWPRFSSLVRSPRSQERAQMAPAGIRTTDRILSSPGPPGADSRRLRGRPLPRPGEQAQSRFTPGEAHAQTSNFAGAPGSVSLRTSSMMVSFGFGLTACTFQNFGEQ